MKSPLFMVLLPACGPLMTPQIVVTPSTCYCISHPPETAEEAAAIKRTEKSVAKAATAKHEKQAREDLGREVGKLKEQVEGLKGIAEESATGTLPAENEK